MSDDWTEVEEVADDVADLAPPPVNGLIKLARRAVSAIGRLLSRKRRERIDAERATYQAAGRAAKASSDATERRGVR